MLCDLVDKSFATWNLDWTKSCILTYEQKNSFLINFISL